MPLGLRVTMVPQAQRVQRVRTELTVHQVQRVMTERTVPLENVVHEDLVENVDLPVLLVSKV